MCFITYPHNYFRGPLVASCVKQALLENHQAVSARCAGRDHDDKLKSIMSSLNVDDVSTSADLSACEITEIGASELSLCPVCNTTGLICHGSHLPSCSCQASSEKKRKTHGPTLKICLFCGVTVCNICEVPGPPAVKTARRPSKGSPETTEELYNKIIATMSPSETGNLATFFAEARAFLGEAKKDFRQVLQCFQLENKGNRCWLHSTLRVLVVPIPLDFLSSMTLNAFDKMDSILQIVIVFVIVHRFSRDAVQLPVIFPTTELTAMILRDLHSINWNVLRHDAYRNERCCTFDRFSSPRQLWKFLLRDRYDAAYSGYLTVKPGGGEAFRKLFAFQSSNMSHCRCKGHFQTRKDYLELEFDKLVTSNDPNQVSLQECAEGDSPPWMGEGEASSVQMTCSACSEPLSLPQLVMTNPPPSLLVVIMVPYSAMMDGQSTAFCPTVALPMHFRRDIFTGRSTLTQASWKLMGAAMSSSSDGGHFTDMVFKDKERCRQFCLQDDVKASSTYQWKDFEGELITTSKTQFPEFSIWALEAGLEGSVAGVDGSSSSSSDRSSRSSSKGRSEANGPTTPGEVMMKKSGGGGGSASLDVLSIWAPEAGLEGSVAGGDGSSSSSSDRSSRSSSRSRSEANGPATAGDLIMKKSDGGGGSAISDVPPAPTPTRRFKEACCTIGGHTFDVRCTILEDPNLLHFQFCVTRDKTRRNVGSILMIEELPHFLSRANMGKSSEKRLNLKDKDVREENIQSRREIFAIHNDLFTITKWAISFDKVVENPAEATTQGLGRSRNDPPELLCGREKFLPSAENFVHKIALRLMFSVLTEWHGTRPGSVFIAHNIDDDIKELERAARRKADTAAKELERAARAATADNLKALVFWLKETHGILPIGDGYINGNINQFDNWIIGLRTKKTSKRECLALVNKR